jgi:hypothetical protein
MLYKPALKLQDKLLSTTPPVSRTTIAQMPSLSKSEKKETESEKTKRLQQEKKKSNLETFKEELKRQYIGFQGFVLEMSLSLRQAFASFILVIFPIFFKECKKNEMHAIEIDSKSMATILPRPKMIRNEKQTHPVDIYIQFSVL